MVIVSDQAEPSLPWLVSVSFAACTRLSPRAYVDGRTDGWMDGERKPVTIMYNSRSDRQPRKGEVISQPSAATFSCSLRSLAGFFPPSFPFSRASPKNKSLSATFGVGKEREKEKRGACACQKGRSKRRKSQAAKPSGN